MTLPAMLEGRGERVQNYLLLVVSLCVSGLSLFLLLTPPATDYENIYEAYPELFWLLFSAGFVCSAAMLIVSAVRRDNYWKLAFLFAGIMYVLFNLLPLFRGWALYGRYSADVLAHVSIANSIIENAYISSNNYYPVIHVLQVELRFLGIPDRVASPLLSATFTGLYLLGVYAFTNEFFEDKRVSILAVACAIPPLYSKFQHTFHPAIFSFMLIPLYLFLFTRIQRVTSPVYIGFLILGLPFLVLFHPVSTLYLIFILAISILAKKVHERIDSEKRPVAPEFILIVGCSGLWLLWYLQFPAIAEYLETALTVSPGGEETVATTYGTQQIQNSRSLSQIAVGFVDKYGPIFLVCGIAALGSLTAVLKELKGDGTFQENWLTAQFLFGVGLSLFSIFTYVFVFNPVRNSRYMILMAVLLSGAFLFRLLIAWAGNYTRPQQLAVLAVVVLLLASIPVGVTNSYQTRYHMTYQEKDGTEWFYEHWNTDSLAVSHHVSDKMRRFLCAGYFSSSGFREYGNRSGVPVRFGYDNNSSLAPVANGMPRYVVTKTYDLESIYSYEEFVREKYVAYRPEDLQTLTNDSAVNKVYANGGYTVWTMNHTARDGNESGVNASTPRRRDSSRQRDCRGEE